MKFRYSLMTAVICLLPSFALLAQQAEQQPVDGEEQAATTQKKDEPVPFQEVRTFTDIFSRIKQDYVDEVEDKALMKSAIRGMLAGLDPHSAYLDKTEYQDLHEGTTGEFGGLGIEVGLEDGFIKVISPIDDTPAQRAGIKAGDTIIRLDNQTVKGLSLDEAVKIMRGKPGDAIEVTVVREGVEKPLKFNIVRAVIQVKSVKSRILEPGYFYLRITQFQTRTAKLLESAMERMRKEDKAPLKGVVLDLRNNPGGVLNGAVDVSDAFLDEGMIVYTEGRGEGAASEFHARQGDLISGLPLVVLVNAGSASASEIVAGALQDHGRAILVGEKTFGKGSVQTILPMNNGDAIKLTTARYFTPSGHSIQAKGITPDIELQSLEVVSKRADGFRPLKEAQLSGHLTNGEEQADDSTLVKEINSKKKSLAEEDYPLFQALNLLKSLTIINKAQASQ